MEEVHKVILDEQAFCQAQLGWSAGGSLRQAIETYVAAVDAKAGPDDLPVELDPVALERAAKAVVRYVANDYGLPESVFDQRWSELPQADREQALTFARVFVAAYLGSPLE